MRCKACNAMMYGSPFYIKVPDDLEVINEYCNKCTQLSNYTEDAMAYDESNFIREILDGNIRYLSYDELY